MSARRDERQIVFQIDEIGSVTILDGGRFIGVLDGAVMAHEIFKARLAAWSSARFQGKGSWAIFSDFCREKDGGSG